MSYRLKGLKRTTPYLQSTNKGISVISIISDLRGRVPKTTVYLFKKTSRLININTVILNNFAIKHKQKRSLR